MIIIIEGPDGAGKSSLAAQMSRQTGYPVVHRSAPKTEEEKQTMYKMYEQAIAEGYNIIFDRCWYSEMVYGPVMRDETVMSYPEMYRLEQLLAAQGAIIIYCTGPAEVLWHRCTTRGEDYITSSSTFAKICDKYDELMNDVPHYIPVVTYEYKEV